MLKRLIAWFVGTKLSPWLAAVVIVGTAAICLFITSWALRYQSSLASEKPSAADWLQGWGTIFGLIATSLAAAAAVAVYIESRKAARLAEERRLEDRAEAAEAAKIAEERWRQERDDAAAVAAANESRGRAELAEARRATALAEAQAEEERKHRRQERRRAQLTLPRAVLATRVAVGMAGAGQVFTVTVSVQNFGTQPLRLVRCYVQLKGADEEVGMQAPHIGPGELKELAWRAAGNKHLAVPMREVPEWHFDTESDFWIVRLRFLDDVGQAWERINNGDPTEVSSTLS
ncbi:MAG: hypothetical protein ABW022_21345 [Actinoplanes sp.]